MAGKLQRLPRAAGRVIDRVGGGSFPPLLLMEAGLWSELHSWVLFSSEAEGREDVEGRRDPGAGNHLSCACKSVPFVSEHAHWGTLGSHQIQPPNLNWREGKLRRWLLCCTPLCLFGSHPAWLLLHLRLYGWKGEHGLHWKRWTALTGSYVRWVCALFLSSGVFCHCTVYLLSQEKLNQKYKQQLI